MTLTVAGNLAADEKTRRYVTALIRSLEKYVPKNAHTAATAHVTLDRIDKPHGNKYRAEVIVKVGSRTYEAADSTLNVFAALDIVRLKLALMLKKDAPQRLRKRQNRV